jgi:hypothetical protein
MLLIGVFKEMIKGYEAVQRATIMMFPADPSRIVTRHVAVDEITIFVITHDVFSVGVQLIVSVVAPRALYFLIGVGKIDMVISGI